MPAGRPTDYNLQMCIEICEHIANGKNVKDTLNANDAYPVWQTFRRWKREKPELNALYVNAIQDKAEMILCEIDEIALDLRNGLIDAPTANVLIQTLKWKAAKFYPKMYGDRQTVEHEGEILHELKVTIVNKPDGR